MERLLPFFDVQGPNGEQFTVELTKERMTVGRFEIYNDIALEPDPQQLVTRKVHCTLDADYASIDCTFFPNNLLFTRRGYKPFSPGTKTLVLLLLW